MAVRVQVPPSAPYLKRLPNRGPFLMVDLKPISAKSGEKECLSVHLNAGTIDPPDKSIYESHGA